MPEPTKSRRQKLVEAVKARLAAIKVADGYRTDVGLKQHEWLGRKLADDELPAHIVRDGEAKPVFDDARKDASKLKWSLPFVIDLVFKEGAATVVDARKGIADVHQAVGVDEKWKVGAEYLAARTVPDGDQVMADKEGNFLSGARVKFSIEYYLDRWEAD
jgi:hypothetical protein